MFVQVSNSGSDVFIADLLKADVASFATEPCQAKLKTILKKMEELMRKLVVMR